LFHKKHWQKKELFHVKHFPKSRAFLRLREDRQSDPKFKNRDNAECAPESLPEAAGFILRMFQLHEHRPREVVFMFRLVPSAIRNDARKSLPVSASRPRVPSIPA